MIERYKFNSFARCKYRYISSLYLRLLISRRFIEVVFTDLVIVDVFIDLKVFKPYFHHCFFNEIKRDFVWKDCWQGCTFLGGWTNIFITQDIIHICGSNDIFRWGFLFNHRHDKTLTIETKWSMIIFHHLCRRVSIRCCVMITLHWNVFGSFVLA